MKSVRLNYRGRSVVVRYEKVAGVLWAHVEGETYEFSAQKRGRRAGRAASSNADDPSLVCAPMPGRLMKIFVERGAKVIAGQELVVMEAMKMEYVLKAGAAGKIEEVNGKSGDQVALGQVLLRLSVE